MLDKYKFIKLMEEIFAKLSNVKYVHIKSSFYFYETK